MHLGGEQASRWSKVYRPKRLSLKVSPELCDEPSLNLTSCQVQPASGIPSHSWTFYAKRVFLMSAKEFCHLCFNCCTCFLDVLSMMLLFADELLSKCPSPCATGFVNFSKECYPNPKTSSELKKPCEDEVNN